MCFTYIVFFTRNVCYYPHLQMKKPIPERLCNSQDNITSTRMIWSKNSGSNFSVNLLHSAQIRNMIINNNTNKHSI